MKKSAVLILSFILVPFVCVIAQELPTVDEVLGKLDTANDALKSFSAKFKQVEKDEFGEEIVTQGDAYFLSPGRMLMVSYLRGEKREEVGKNEEYAWRIRHNVATVDRFKVDDEEKDDESFSITEAEDLKREYDLKVVGIEKLDSGDAYHLVGTAKEKRKIRKVEVWINVESPAPVIKAISHQRRAVTEFTLFDIKRDTAVDAGLFKYQVPAGYDETVH